MKTEKIESFKIDFVDGGEDFWISINGEKITGEMTAPFDEQLKVARTLSRLATTLWFQIDEYSKEKITMTHDEMIAEVCGWIICHANEYFSMGSCPYGGCGVSAKKMAEDIKDYLCHQMQ